LNLAELSIVLQKILGQASVSPIFLDAFFVVNIHVEISAVLLGEGDAFVVDLAGVLDGGDSGEDCVLDALRGVRMRFDAEAEVTGFIDRGAQLFEGEFLRVGIAAVREDGAARKNLDVSWASLRMT
jgi:hypothetical protein